MALKATIHKAHLNLSDLDRQVYAEHAVTLARHPSETDERMLIRLLAFALHAPASADDPPLVLAKDLWEPDEPSLWQKDPTGGIRHWIEVGLPDERRFLRVSPRVELLTVYAYGTGATLWWTELQPRLTRLRNVQVFRLPPAQSQALAALAQRTLRLQITVQDGAVWVDDGASSVEITVERLAG